MLRKNDQNAILQKLGLYIAAQTHFNKQYSKEGYLNLITKSAGYCFSFSICRAAMRRAGMLNWWEAALEEISAWDDYSNYLSLQKQIKLPDMDLPVTLESIMDRVANYIVFNHGSNEAYPHIDLEQRSFLQPGGPFELLH